MEPVGEASPEAPVDGAPPPFEAMAKRAEVDEEETMCNICFEDLGELGGAVALPCACRLAYCHVCWDRTLAASMGAVGCPRCPSCRSALRVDYESHTGRLVFSRQEQSDEIQVGVVVPNNETRARLGRQILPRQKELLRQHGARLAALAVALAAATDDAESATAASSTPPPRCVCAGELQQMKLRERVYRVVDPPQEGGVLRHGGESLTVDRLISMGAITCDICTDRIQEYSFVWTCEKGKDTILHAHSFDICTPCFDKYTDPNAEPDACAPST